MHEDLNTASRRRKTHKRYKLQVKSGSTATNDSKSGSAPEAADQKPDEAQQAADALDSYMKSNSSFVMDIFQVTIVLLAASIQGEGANSEFVENAAYLV